MEDIIKPNIKPLPIGEGLERRLWCGSGFNKEFQKIHNIINGLDFRTLICFVWDNQEGFENHFFKYGERDAKIGYTYGNKFRREALANVKPRFRKWQRSEGGQLVLEHGKEYNREHQRGNTEYEHPEWFLSHYRNFRKNLRNDEQTTGIFGESAE